MKPFDSMSEELHVYKRLSFLSISFILLNALTTNLFSAENTESYNYRKAVQGMERLHNEADKNFPPHFLHTNSERMGSEFDTNNYFQVLTHLSLPEKCVLDYVYWFDGDGRPYLYVRKDSEKPYTTHAEFQVYTGWDKASKEAEELSKNDPNYSKETREKISRLLKPVEEKEKMYLTSVQTDGSPEGFFELVVYHVLAGQFYLAWHCNYNDTQIAANKEDIKRIIREVSKENFGTSLTWSQKRRAKKIDPQPHVELTEDTAKVSIVVFSKWGGFGRRTFYFRRSYPHLLLKQDYEPLVEYDCQVMF